MEEALVAVAFVLRASAWRFGGGWRWVHAEAIEHFFLIGLGVEAKDNVKPIGFDGGLWALDADGVFEAGAVVLRDLLGFGFGFGDGRGGCYRRGVCGGCFIFIGCGGERRFLMGWLGGRFGLGR